MAGLKKMFLRHGHRTFRRLAVPYQSLYFAQRRTIGLAVREEDRPTEIKNPPEKQEPSTTISSISSGISSALGMRMADEPYFNVIANGVGSITHVQIPEDSYLFCQVGTVTGMSDTLSNSQTLLGGVMASVQRKVAGGNMYVSRISADSGQPGDVLLAPNGLGDVATVEMDGRTQYCINKGNFLACSPHVRIGVHFLDSWSLRSFGLASLVASGRGTLVITSYGGLFRLVLEKGEKYQVSRRHLVAWDSRMTPEPVHKNPPEDGILGAITDVVNKGLDWVIEKPDMCLLEGPGDFYIASRIEPEFEVGRNAMRKVRQYIRVPGPIDSQESIGEDKKGVSKALDSGRVKAANQLTAGSSTDQARNVEIIVKKPKSPPPLNVSTNVTKENVTKKK